MTNYDIEKRIDKDGTEHVKVVPKVFKKTSLNKPDFNKSKE